jgi:hypothetical protein
MTRAGAGASSRGMTRAGAGTRRQNLVFSVFIEFDLQVTGHTPRDATFADAKHRAAEKDVVHLSVIPLERCPPAGPREEREAAARERDRGHGGLVFYAVRRLLLCFTSAEY